MANTFEERLGHVGAKVDEAKAQGKERVDQLVDRIEEILEDLRAGLDDLKVKASLGKLEARDKAEPLVEALRNRSLDARESLTELREELSEAGGALSMGAQVAVEDLEVGVESAADALK